MQHIQGEERNQLQMFCLEQMVEADSFVRVIDYFVDTIDLESFGFRNVKLKEEGRPPYHPAVLMKLYFYGYRYGIRSSRKMEREARLNLEVRWLLCEQTPSARTICMFRKEYAESFKAIFRKFVFLLKELGLMEGKTIAIDSFKVRAQNSLKHNYNQKKIDRQLEYIDGRIKEFEDALDEADSQEQKTVLKDKIAVQQSRMEKYQAIEAELKETGKDQISTTDQDAQSVVLQRGITVVGYNIQASVDAKNKLIAHFDTGGVNDTNALGTVAVATKEVLQVEQMDVLADKGYHTGEQIRQCEQNGITTYVSPKEPASNDPDIFPITSFVYDTEKDCYTCPAGETLTPNGTWLTHSSKGYKSAYKFQRYNNPAKCRLCEMHSLCTKSKNNGRNIDRSEFAADVEQNNQRVKENPAYYKQRQQLAEHPWGTLKRQRGFDYVLTRGKKNVLGEVSLVFIGYNLSRFIQITEGINAFKELIKGVIAHICSQQAYLKAI
ncbi:IS1182 family transposase [Microbacter margulisiae]|uniref:Transposase n=1 Tax=Microbacter margulisiae TaxID=1350067 RepID=A0A7W5DNR0_9PORP|nr:IS1182 family transposase [Microbacter margulisiae]MBB3186325.1 transposase [Microbacter margulisiae]